uniref:Uncharacterized protein n=1 Tax=Setaria viridis TaxID=4556 RepID=A0A4U6UN38_SETVI|nr:hypothetical protein SEVIR_5G388350v2 [Setaria viridis]
MQWLAGLFFHVCFMAHDFIICCWYDSCPYLTTILEVQISVDIILSVNSLGCLSCVSRVGGGGH